MNTSPWKIFYLSFFLGCVCSLSNASEQWPAKPIRMIVPFPPGGGTDIVARTVGQKLSEALKQSVIIDNKPGAATVIGADAVAKAQPDGYTLLLSGSSTYTVNPALRPKMPYDTFRDLTPIAIVAKTPLVLLVSQNSPWNTLTDLIAAAKKQPNSVTYATYGPGSAAHLAGSMFAEAADVELQAVPYRGGPQANLAVLSGDVHISIDTAAGAVPQVKSGKMKALAVFGPNRASLLPEIRTMTELNFPTATFDGWYALSAPSNTPAIVIKRLNHEIRMIMNDPVLKGQLKSQAMEPVFIDSASTRIVMETEISKYRAIAHRAKIVVD